MYTYNKNDKSYTFSSDELDIDKIVDTVKLDNEDTLNTTDTSSDSNSSDATSTSDFDNNSSTSSTSDASNNSITSNTSDSSNNSSTSNTSDASNNSGTSNTYDASDNSDQPVREKPRKIEVINGGNDLDISPVTNYIEVEKPRNEKKENIVIPKNNKWHFGALVPVPKSAKWHF